jgi:hypothetical protein
MTYKILFQEHLCVHLCWDQSSIRPIRFHDKLFVFQVILDNCSHNFCSLCSDHVHFLSNPIEDLIHQWNEDLLGKNRHLTIFI